MAANEQARTEYGEAYRALHKELQLLTHKCRVLGEAVVVPGSRHEGALHAARRLLEEAAICFGREEELMNLADYPNRDHHFRQHVALITEMALTLDKLSSGREARINSTVSFLCTWLRMHIEMADGSFAQWLGVDDGASAGNGPAPQPAPSEHRSGPVKGP